MSATCRALCREPKYGSMGVPAPPCRGLGSHAGGLEDGRGLLAMLAAQSWRRRKRWCGCSRSAEVVDLVVFHPICNNLMRSWMAQTYFGRSLSAPRPLRCCSHEFKLVPGLQSCARPLRRSRSVSRWGLQQLLGQCMRGAQHHLSTTLAASRCLENIWKPIEAARYSRRR